MVSNLDADPIKGQYSLNHQAGSQASGIRPCPPNIIHMSYQRIVSLVFITGSVIFLVAAFSPVSRVFGESDPARKLEIIMGSRQAWTLSQWLFGLGAVIVAVGFAVSASHSHGIDRLLAFLAFFLLIIGAGLWSRHVYLRAIEPQSFTTGVLPAWHFVSYTLLTQAGLVLIGIAFLHSGLPSWVGWMNIGGAVLFFVAYMVFRDMPPFVYYILTLITGVMLYGAG